MQRKDYFYNRYSGRCETSEEVRKEYDRMIHREKYVDRKEHTLSINYEDEEQLYQNPLMLNKISSYEKDSEEAEKEDNLSKQLTFALTELKKHNQRDYNILMDYYFTYEKISMVKLAEKYGVSSQTIWRRLERSYQFIRKQIIKWIEQNKQ